MPMNIQQSNRRSISHASKLVALGILVANYTFPVSQLLTGSIPQFEIAFLQSLWQCILLDAIVTIKLWNH